jgi:hypothetical protein
MKKFIEGLILILFMVGFFIPFEPDNNRIFKFFSELSAFENGVREQPRVFCGPDGIHVLVRTHHPFHGRLFVQVNLKDVVLNKYLKEESERPECMHSYVDGIDGDDHNPSDNSAEFHLKFGACNMRRQRTVRDTDRLKRSI